MEPFINSDLRSATNLNLTPSLMQDIGWNLETLKIENCDTGVPNALMNGDLLNVQVDACSGGAKNKGQFVRCVAQTEESYIDAGLLMDEQKDSITSCAARN